MAMETLTPTVPEFRVESVPEADGVTLRLSGEFDVYTSPHLKQAIIDQLQAGAARICLDLANVVYIDGTGLGVLVGAYKRAVERDRELLLTGADERLRRVFQTTGLDRILPNDWTDRFRLRSAPEGEK